MVANNFAGSPFLDWPVGTIKDKKRHNWQSAERDKAIEEGFELARFTTATEAVPNLRYLMKPEAVVEQVQ